MTVFVDTSVLYAVLDKNDPRHPDAAEAFEQALDASPLLTHNYVLVEAMALVARRLSLAAVRTLTQELLAPVRVEWVDNALHTAAVSAVLASSAKRPSFVDRVSFELMHRRGVESALALDRDFRSQGFRTIPA